MARTPAPAPLDTQQTRTLDLLAALLRGQAAGADSRPHGRARASAHTARVVRGELGRNPLDRRRRPVVDCLSCGAVLPVLAVAAGVRHCEHHPRVSLVKRGIVSTPAR